MAEFWYGYTPRKEIRLHKQFYPSCIEKCSPILQFMKRNENPEIKDEKLSIPNLDHKTVNLEPSIIYEDGNIIVIEKPMEYLSTPAKDLSLPNVEAWLHEKYPEVKGPMLVHRLDQSTSGLMIAAKNASVFKTLQQGFLDHSIRKTYLAWINGDLSTECGVINLPICPNPDDRPRQTTDRQFGKQSVTRYKIIKREQGKTLLELYPFTGRTHQLRLHCASPFGLNTPIVGDRLYTVSPFQVEDTRLMLHAARIRFTLFGKEYHFESTQTL